MYSKPVSQISSAVLLFLSALFVLYAGDKSLVIADAGISNDIPQLIGDGGAGIFFAAICLAAAGLGIWLRRTSAVLYVIAIIVIITASFIYQDNGMFVWAVPPLLFAAGELVLRRLTQGRRGTANGKGVSHSPCQYPYP